MWSFGIALITGLTLLLTSGEALGEMGGSPGTGPYRVGSTFLLEPDHSRQHQNGTARPVPVVVLYPVDAEKTVEALPARYPRNPFTNQQSEVFLSTHFEVRGLDAAYDGATPSTAGPFPLLMLSNGARQPYWYNLGIALRVAGHGFVVALMGHYGEAAYANPAPSDPLMHVAQRGVDRILDVKLLIDRLLLRNTTPGDPLEGVIQADRIAVGGHSFGGLTAVQVTGGDDLVCDTYNQPNPPPATCVPFLDVDTRVTATVLLDASTQNMRYHELARFTAATLMIGEDIDSIEKGIAVGDFAAVPTVLHGRAHHAYGGRPSYRVDVLTSTHVASFTNACQATLVRGDIGLLTPAQVQLQLTRLHCNDTAYIPYQMANELVWRYAVAFLTGQLAGDPTYQEILTPGWAVSREPFAMFFVNERQNGQSPPPDDDFPDESWFHFSQPDRTNHPDPYEEPLVLDAE